MKYVAIVRFADLTDNKHIYEAGAEFPRPGFAVSEERLKKLSGRDNLMGYPLIKAIETETPEEQPKQTETPKRGGKKKKVD